MTEIAAGDRLKIKELIDRAVMNAIEAKDLDFLTSWVTLFDYAEKRDRDPYVFGFFTFLNAKAELQAKQWLADKRYS